MTTTRSRRVAFLVCLLFTTASALGWCSSLAAAEAEAARVLIIVGPSQHPPGTHEVPAGARLLENCLENSANVGPIDVGLFDTWPNKQTLKKAATVVFVGDLFPPERMENPDRIKAELGKMMDAGCGIVCLHFATGLRKQHVAEDGAHPLLRWLGGYYSSGCPHHKSVARVLTATISPDAGDHPILHGWGEFTFHDEPYWNNYFGKDGPAENVTSLAFAMLPADAPKKETVAWAVERQDGGRGVGIVMPHFYRNWKRNDLRIMVLNSICWTAKLEIPADGVKSPVPDLAAFEPDAVEPVPK